MSETNQCDCRYLKSKVFGEDCDKCIIERLKNEIAFLKQDIKQLEASRSSLDVFVVVADHEVKNAVVCGAFTKRDNAVKDLEKWQRVAPLYSYTVQGIAIRDDLYLPTCTTPTSSNAKIKRSIQDTQQMSKPDL